MHVVAITGFSGSGKTTLIVQLIEHFIAAGKSVGAIKHTHHPLSEEDRGDTARFRAAGANPVLLAHDTEAVIFDRPGTLRIRVEKPADLLLHFDTDIVLIEGFRHGPWPRIEVSADALPTLADVLADLDRIWRP